MSTQRADSGPEPIRPADVCSRLDVQPYILKFWEGEFPLLGRRVGPKRLYDGPAVEMVREIRRLVLDERRSLGEARLALDTLFAAATPGPVEAVPVAPAASEAGAPAAGLEEQLREAEARAIRLEREVAAAQDVLRRVQALQGRVADLEDALARAESDKRSALAAQSAESNAELGKVRELVKTRDAELARAREETGKVRGRLDEERQGRLRAESDGARVSELGEQVARLERELVAERQRHAETAALLEGLRARQSEAAQADLAWRADVSRTISAALREVREIAFHAEGLEAALKPTESRPRRPAPAPPPVAEPPADIEDLAAQALEESLAGADVEEAAGAEDAAETAGDEPPATP